MGALCGGGNLPQVRGVAPRASVPVSIELEATVTRANGCVEELGTVAYWHRNPLRRAWARIRGRR